MISLSIVFVGFPPPKFNQSKPVVDRCIEAEAKKVFRVFSCFVFYALMSVEKGVLSLGETVMDY